eukprot:scaffold1.g5390.t1
MAGHGRSPAAGGLARELRGRERGAVAVDIPGGETEPAPNDAAGSGGLLPSSLSTGLFGSSLDAHHAFGTSPGRPLFGAPFSHYMGRSTPAHSLPHSLHRTSSGRHSHEAPRSLAEDAASPAPAPSAAPSAAAEEEAAGGGDGVAALPVPPLQKGGASPRLPESRVVCASADTGAALPPTVFEGTAAPGAFAAPPPSPRSDSVGLLPRRSSMAESSLMEPLLEAPLGQKVRVLHNLDARSTDITRALVFGFINSVAAIPALIAFAAIVFRDEVYAPNLDLLCKFFFASSALHQAVFCLCSSLPFSIGQVQDVGLIFLSAMASSVAVMCAQAGRDAATALGTCLLTMAVATFLVGAGTLLVAKFKLAQVVQYMPLPVVGGYLGFVGWVRLFARDPLIKLAPTVASCAAMVATLEHFEHPLALPGVLVAINAAFHAGRLALGVSMADAQAARWVLKPSQGPAYFWQARVFPAMVSLWGMFNLQHGLGGIYWPALAAQGIKCAGLFLVVCFGSCMDIAAIQQEMPEKIDFNAELTTVALSNMATAAAGLGYTGSYIFSQTVFTMRAGVFSRLNGWLVCLSELALFVLPVSVVQYMPNFFFGSLLVWFGVEISRDWLILSFKRLTRMEYALLWLTFAAIMRAGLEGGILVGILLATLYFAWAYAKSQASSLVVAPAHSAVVRTLEQQAALDAMSGRARGQRACRGRGRGAAGAAPAVLRRLPAHMVTARLQGFIFFGSANSLGGNLGEVAEQLSASDLAGIEGALVHSLRTVGERYAGAKHAAAAAALAAAPKFLVLDFTQAGLVDSLFDVRGIDATGARTFKGVTRELSLLGITAVIANAGCHGIRELLLAHGVPLHLQVCYNLSWPPAAPPPPPAAGGLPPGGGSAASLQQGLEGPPGANAEAEGGLDLGGGRGSEAGEEVVWEFRSLEEGLRFCEDQFLEVAVRCRICKPPSAKLTLEELLRVARALLRHVTRCVPGPGDVLWSDGDEADFYFIIEKGSLRMDEYAAEPALSFQASPHAGEGEDGAPRGGRLVRSRSGRRVRVQSFELGPGCVAGSTDFYLARPHGTRAVCTSAGTRLLRVSREAVARLAADNPEALNVLQLCVMRANTLDLSVEAAAGRSLRV